MNIKVETDSEKCTMFLNGDLDLYSSTFLKESFNKVKAGATKTLIINMADVPYLDSSGIGILINILSTLRNENKTMVLQALNDQCMHVLRLTNLHTFFTVK